MKNKALLLVGAVSFSLLILPLGSSGARALDFSQPTGFVNDFVGVLDASQKDALEQTLVRFEKDTSNEVVIAIVKSLEGLDRFDYSQQLFTEWKIGKEGKNNGILFLISPSDREAFINVGRGLEGALPDSVTGTILRNEVFPAFKENRYADGIGRGVVAIMQATKGEYKADDSSSSSALSFIDQWGGLLFIPIIFLLHSASFFLGRTRSWWLGGVMGGGVGLLIGLIFLAGFVIVLPALFLTPLGLFFDFVVSKNYESRKKRGLSTDFWHSGGGFWFGGGRSGFGGGGGFGGFGGGMSGGGGAGGKW